MSKIKRLKLSAKIGIGIILLGMIVIIVSCYVGYRSYETDVEQYYNDSAYEIAYLTGSIISGDDVARYLETGEVDDKYYETLEYIDLIRENLSANYIYVAEVIDGYYITYVFDAENPDDAYDRFILGDTGLMTEEYIADVYLVESEGARPDNYFYSESQFGYNTTALAPLYDSSGNIVALVGVELSMQGLQDMLNDYMYDVFTITPLVILLLLALFMFFIRKSVIKPLDSITQASDDFMQTKLVSEEKLMSVNTGDELQVLARAIAKMQTDTLNYLDEIKLVTGERERIGAELDVAKHIQADMLPTVFPKEPEIPFVKIFASMTPAKEVGGDFYDFFDIDGDHIGLVMADVSGKGIPAALFMVIAKTLIKNAAQSGISPKEVFEKVNNELCENNAEEMFVTCWLGILNTKSGKLQAVSAGHEYPVIKRKAGEFEIFKDVHGFVMGGMENMRYRQYDIQLNEGDTIFLYTDGVPEATNIQNELYGMERMVKKLNQCKESYPKEQIEAVLADVMEFTGEAEQFDDVTMLGVTRTADNVIYSEKEFVPSDEDSTMQVMGFIEEMMEKGDLPIIIQSKMSIVIDEIYSNIALYSSASSVNIACSIFTDKITITFKDNGVKYNPLEKQDADITLGVEERSIGGLGILITKKTMDEVKYRYLNGNNILILEKNY